jgi:hypothetical protein
VTTLVRTFVLQCWQVVHFGSVPVISFERPISFERLQPISSDNKTNFYNLQNNRLKPRGSCVEMINLQWFHKFLWIWMVIFKKVLTFTIKPSFPSNAIYYLLTTDISHFFFLNSCFIAYATEAEGRTAFYMSVLR